MTGQITALKDSHSAALEQLNEEHSAELRAKGSQWKALQRQLEDESSRLTDDLAQTQASLDQVNVQLADLQELTGRQVWMGRCCGV